MTDDVTYELYRWVDGGWNKVMTSFETPVVKRYLSGKSGRYRLVRVVRETVEDIDP